MNILFLFYANFVTDSSLGDIQVSENTHTLCSGSVYISQAISWFLKVKSVPWPIISSVPAFKSEWYWKRLMDGDSEFVEFHNRVYGCSGVMPDKYPCTGPSFSYASRSLFVLIQL